MYEDKLSDALSLAHEGIKTGHRDYQMLSLLGTVLMHAGAVPGQPEFAEARGALETSVALHPAYSTSQIALGKLYLMEGHLQEAVLHSKLVAGWSPGIQPSIRVWQERIDSLETAPKAEESLAVLSSLLHEKTSKANSGSP